MKIRKYTFTSIIIVLSLLFQPVLAQKKVSLHFVNKTLNKGKVLTVKGNMYYNIQEGKLISHYNTPKEIITINRRSGETKMYQPQNNTVRLKQASLLKSKNSLIALFINQRTQDLGLQELGFNISETERENNYLVTHWQAPKSENKKAARVKLVHENQLPVYAEYYNEKEQKIKKIYYSEYRHFQSFMLPLKTTEISYMPNGDSLITRTKYSNILTGKDAKHEYFNFQIPTDAKIID